MYYLAFDPSTVAFIPISEEVQTFRACIDGSDRSTSTGALLSAA